MTQMNHVAVSMLRFTIRCVILPAPGLLLAFILAACMPQAAALTSPMSRSNGSKYKATATVLQDQASVSKSVVESSIENNPPQDSRKPKGKATILRAADGSTETFGVGDNIIVDIGDIITAWEGKTVITFFAGHTTTLTPVSKIKVVALSKNSGIETISLYQSLGSSKNQVDKSTADEVEFDISTDSSIASVRGTNFNVQICGPEQTFYQTFTGSIDVAKEKETVSLDAGHQLLAAVGQDMEVYPLPEQPICADERVALNQPLNGQFVFTSTIPIYGTVTHANFDYWKLEYKPVANSSDSYSFLTRGEEPLSSALLTNLDISHLTNGAYTLRLMVVDKSGNYPEPCTINVHLYPRHNG